MSLECRGARKGANYDLIALQLGPLDPIELSSHFPPKSMTSPVSGRLGHLVKARFLNFPVDRFSNYNLRRSAVFAELSIGTKLNTH